MLKWIRNRMESHRRERMRSTIEANANGLESTHRSRFAGCDKERFSLLWCVIAEASKVPVHELRAETDLGHGLAQQRTRWWQTSRQDDLEYLIAMESRGRLPPASALLTIGDVLDYLLE